MYVNLIGIVEDGSERALEVPNDNRQALLLPQGSSVTIEVAIVTPENTPVVIGVGDKISMSISNKPSLSTLVKLTGAKTEAAAGNIAAFEILPATLSALTPGRYAYAVWLTQATVRNQVVPLSNLVLSPELN